MTDRSAYPSFLDRVRRNTSTGQFIDIQKAASMGRQDTGDRIFNGSLGIYNSTILRSAYDVTDGVSAAGADVPTVRRAIFLGGQACMMGFGRDNGPSKITWNEELFDHKRRLVGFRALHQPQGDQGCNREPSFQNKRCVGLHFSE
jgi:hypothetical protein